jgi:hypothetical protein
MDMTESIEARSDQINADDLIAGPQTFTIRDVVGGKAEAPFDFLLMETDRAYRPNKTMRRVIVAAWGKDTTAYAGRRLTLYREPTIVFGGKTVGGIRVSHMSHIDGAVDLMAQVTRGKREKFVVKPLAAAPAPQPASDTAKDWDAVLATAKGLTDTEALSTLWRSEHMGSAPNDVQAAFLAHVDAVKAKSEESTDA